MKLTFAKLVLLAVLVVASLGVAPPAAEALSCVDNSDNLLQPRAHMEARRYVFTAEVVNLEVDDSGSGGTNFHTLTVGDWIKGESKDDRVIVKSDSTWGPRFDVGSTGLFIFAVDSPPADLAESGSLAEFSIPLCQDNPAFVSADSDLYNEYSAHFEDVRNGDTPDPEQPAQPTEPPATAEDDPIISRGRLIYGGVALISVMIIGYSAYSARKDGSGK